MTRGCGQLAAVPEFLLPLSLLPRAHRHSSIVRSKHFQYHMFLDFRHGLLALWRLAWHETETPRFVPIAIAGVWNWRGKVGKANGPHGERVDVDGPIADLGRVAWSERRTLIVFDTNVHSND